MISAYRASVVQGLSAMSLHPLRTALSTLGVVIGVASVMATLALADGLERYARAQIAVQTDVQSIMVESRTEELRDGFAVPARRYPVFTIHDAAELRRSLGAAAEVTMVASGRAVVMAPPAPAHAATVTATLDNYLVFGQKSLAAGRFFTEGETWRNVSVSVLSNKLARELSPNGDAAAMVERVVRVHGRSFTVVGIMSPFTGERGYQVIVPVRAAAATFGSEHEVTPALVVRARRIEMVDATKDAVCEWLASRYVDWEDQVSVSSSAARLEQARSGMLILKLILAALAGISLVVGGVGIMNVLLASVAERTREIGVRKALGARHRDILYQFLAEAMAIAGLGSGIGTTLGIIAAVVLAAVVRARVPGADLHAVVTSATLLTSVVTAAAIGLIFGIVPALRAARLSPIDAIRHE